MTAVAWRLAVVSDTHVWPHSSAQASWQAISDGAPERDGLLVGNSTELLHRLLDQLRDSAGNATFLHLGDVGCGGGGFNQPVSEYIASLRMLRRMEHETGIMMHHCPGNHDLNPSTGGLDAWRREFLTNEVESAAPEAVEEVSIGADGSDARTVTPAAAAISTAYRSIPLSRGWRLITLDATDGVGMDVDGHGQIGEVQLRWLDEQLGTAAAAREHVVLAMHQLLVDPSEHAAQLWSSARRKGSSNGGDSWLGPVAAPSWIGEGDLIRPSDREAVLHLLRRHAGVVKLSLHGHIHANTLAIVQGCALPPRHCHCTAAAAPPALTSSSRAPYLSPVRCRF